jgi:hypothetical protein
MCYGKLNVLCCVLRKCEYFPEKKLNSRNITKVATVIISIIITLSYALGGLVVSGLATG